MLKSISGVIKKVFTITNMLGGVCFFSVMVLVLANIIMRNIYKPIRGTYDIVGLLIATGLGLALANCEMQDGNIGMDIELPWFSQKIGKVIEIVSFVISLSFWAIVVWRIFVYAGASLTNGRVTATASIPIYPFIFVLGFNMLCLCVALAYKLVRAVKNITAQFHHCAYGGKEESK